MTLDEFLADVDKVLIRYNGDDADGKLWLRDDFLKVHEAAEIVAAYHDIRLAEDAQWCECCGEPEDEGY